MARDESRDVWLETEQVEALGLGHGDVWCIRGHEPHAEMSRFVPAADLEAAERRIAELEAEMTDYDSCIGQLNSLKQYVLQLEPLAELAREIGAVWKKARQDGDTWLSGDQLQVRTIVSILDRAAKVATPDCLRRLTPEEYTQVKPLDESVLDEAIRRGKCDAEAFTKANKSNGTQEICAAKEVTCQK